MQPSPYPPPSAYPPAPVAGGRPVVGPSKAWFVVAGLVAVAGIVVAVVVLVRTFTGWFDRIDDFDRAPLPAELGVEITETGGYSIYHEFPGAAEQDLSTPPQVTVTGPDGSQVPLDDYDTSVTYETPDHEGRGAYTFSAEVPGTYLVSATGRPASAIAVGRGVGRGLVTGIVAAVVIGLVAVIAALVLAVVVGVKRSRNRNRLVVASMGGRGAPPPPGWGAPAPAWPGGMPAPPGPGAAPPAWGVPPPPPPPPRDAGPPR